MATYTAVNSGGVTHYLSNGTDVGTNPPTLSSGDILNINAGAVASGVQSVSGGIATVNVSNGGTLTNSTINNSYTYVSSGGVASGNTLNSDAGTTYAGGSNVNNTLTGSNGGADTYTIQSGAVANGTTVQNTNLTVQSGATATNTTVGSGGNLNYTSGANLTGLVVSQGGDVNPGATDGQLVNGGALSTMPAGTTYNAVLSGGQTVYTYTSGATTLSTTTPPVLRSGDILNVSAGAVASGVQTASGGVATINIKSGGTLTDSTVNNSYTYVSAGGVASGNTLNSDAGTTYSGGSNINNTFTTGQYGQDATTYTIASGGVVTNPQYDPLTGGNALTTAAGAQGTVSGATILAPPGTTYTATLVGGQTVYTYTSGGVPMSSTNPPLLQGSDTLNIKAGAVASGVESLPTGINTINVSSGGTLTGSTNNNGYTYVSAGGVASGNTLNSDAGTTYSGGSNVNNTFHTGEPGTDATTYTIASGGVVTNPQYDPLTGGNALTTAAGAQGTVSGAQILAPPGTTYTASLVGGQTVYTYTSGGVPMSSTTPPLLQGSDTLNVKAGAVASGVQSLPDGINTINVSSGGTLTGSTNNNGYTYVSAGGVASGNTLNSDAGTTYSGGSNINNSFYTGEPGTDATTYTIASGGVVTNPQYSVAGGNSLTTAAGAQGTVSGAQILAPPGTTYTASLVGGQTVYTYTSGGVPMSSTTPPLLQGSDTLNVNSGAIASGVQSLPNGINTINVKSGGELLNSTNNNGYTYVSAGGIASGNTLNSDAGTIYAGGSAVNNTINTGQPDATALTVASGGVVQGGVVTSSALTLTSGSLVSGTTVSGSLNVPDGAVVSNVTVASGASITNDGAMIGTTIQSGGLVTNNAAGTMLNTTDSGGLINLAGPLCFLEGTHVLVGDVEVKVEHLEVGDMVTTLVDGAYVRKAVTWIGKRHIRAGQLPSEQAYPVRICAGAFGDNVPHRDLLITPDHCVFVDGKLIPARMLVNDRSILLDRGMASYTFYHVELAEHAILISEGLATESYLDTGNSGNFSNSDVVSLRPDLALDVMHQRWQTDAVAPLTVDRAQVEPVWQKLDQRAISQGIPSVGSWKSLTSDARMHLVSDSGEKLLAQDGGEGAYSFAVPAGTTSLRLVSRASSPADVIGPYVDDRRQLGVKVAGPLVLTEGDGLTQVTVPLNDTTLKGWHGLEVDGRWTDGNAVLPLELKAGATAFTLKLTIVAAGPYAVESDEYLQAWQASVG